MTERIPHPRDYEAESRRHQILWIGAAVVAVVAVIVYLVVRDDGEENRDAYCAALTDLVGADDLEQAVNDASRTDVEHVTSLAPAAVEPAWNGLLDTVLAGQPSRAQQGVDATKLQAELDKITEDAAENCDLTLPS